MPLPCLLLTMGWFYWKSNPSDLDNAENGGQLPEDEQLLEEPLLDSQNQNNNDQEVPTSSSNRYCYCCCLKPKKAENAEENEKGDLDQQEVVMPTTSALSVTDSASSVMCAPMLSEMSKLISPTFLDEEMSGPQNTYPKSNLKKGGNLNQSIHSTKTSIRMSISDARKSEAPETLVDPFDKRSSIDCVMNPI